MADDKNIGEEFLNLFAESLAKAAEEQKEEETADIKNAAHAAFEIFESFMDAGFNRMESFILLQRIMFGGMNNEKDE